ncbi:hypothetical protein V2J09_021224 [Rumex salicifolius]
MLDKAKKIFDKLYDAGLSPNCITFSAMIRGLCMAGRLEEASNLLFDMGGKGVSPTVSMFNRVMHGFAVKKENEKKMAEKQVVPNASTSTIVLGIILKDENHHKWLEYLTNIPPSAPPPEEIKVEITLAYRRLLLILTILSLRSERHASDRQITMRNRYCVCTLHKFYKYRFCVLRRLGHFHKSQIK